MSERFVVVESADLHLSNALPFAKPTDANGMTDRLLDQMRGLAQMADVAHEVSADAVLLLGDVLDKWKIDGVALRGLFDSLVAFHCPVYIGPGNHECASPSGGRFATEFLDSVRQLGIANLRWMGHGTNGAATKLSGFPAWLHARWVDYASPGRARALLAEARALAESDDPDHKATRLLLTHIAVLGCKDGSWSCTDGVSGPDFAGFDVVRSGHFHDEQPFDVDGGVGAYAGSPWQLSFTDVDKPRGFNVLTFAKGKGLVDVQRVEPSLPVFREYEDIAAFLDAAQDANDYVRVRHHCTHAEWARDGAELRAMAEAARDERGLRLTEVTHVPMAQHTATARLGEGATKLKPEELVERYVLARGVEIGDLDADRLIEVGLEALRGTSS